MDNLENERENDLRVNDIWSKRTDVFYMIQEMESWFLSQPAILDDFYGPDTNGKKVSEKLPRKKPTEIVNPDEELQRLTKNTKKGKYHKIKHGVELLKRLNADQLTQDFADFKRLIERLEDQ